MTKNLTIEELEKRLSGKKVIYVEDSKEDFDTHTRLLKADAGVVFIRAENNGASLEDALKAHPDAIAILSDIERPGRNPEGLRWATQYITRQDVLPVILTSANTRYQEAAAAIGVPFHDKGESALELGTMLVEAFDRQALRTPPATKRDPLKPDGTAAGLGS